MENNSQCGTCLDNLNTSYILTQKLLFWGILYTKALHLESVEDKQS